MGDDLSSIQIDSNEVIAYVLRRQQDNSLFNFEYSLFFFMLNMPWISLVTCNKTDDSMEVASAKCLRVKCIRSDLPRH